ncbi:aminopeptidase N [Aplysia californica]|uniref:Aminopeptidase N n=1 Tax=Aplysia californica TaxID=6500 RepID=A0ABM1A364_APLCA|nr:aminopeptidase N [Aplysia californica]
MANEKYETKDSNTTDSSRQSSLEMASGEKKNGGCYVSGVVGVALTLVAILIAVGVGIIVHFAEGDRGLVCNCGSGAGQTGASSAQSVLQQCAKMAGRGDDSICGQCPSSSVTQSGPFIGHATTPPATPSSRVKVRDVRLPDNVYPEHYDVRLQPYMYVADPKKFTFKGSVKIYLRCDKTSDNVTLHINVLTVDKANIQFQGDPVTSKDDPSVVGTNYDRERQFIILKLDRNMQAGKKYVLEMTFTSPLKDDLSGLYYSTYYRDGKPVYLATTQMEATDARKAFPCFDEPAIKSTFNVTLVRPDNLVSISNMPQIDSSETWEEDGMTYVADVYEQTPKMSTYLLAFIICDFKFKSQTARNGVEYRAWAIPESLNDTEYALGVGAEVLSFYDEFFGVPYPLPKQDMIAIPDFAMGAMENWGLITYRQSDMLFNEDVSNENNKERVTEVVAHELAHQWFGNLVTMSWWGDLWLNEGFANFVEYFGTEHVHPDWNMFEVFVQRELQGAFSFDGLVSSHPVYVPVYHPDEINEIFDDISYSKGGSIIRMMRHFLGFETFRLGLKRYLTNLAYSNAFHDDLWNALTEQSRQEGKNIDVKAIMDTWTLQMNYPVVTVSRDFNDPDMVRVTQERYLTDPSAQDPGKYQSPFDYKWTIPLTLTSHKNPNFNQSDGDILWMYKNETKKTFNIGANNLPPTSDSQGWILANVQQNGYYRVNYPLGNWKALTDQLKDNHTIISTINRAQLINDAWNLAKSGELGLETALSTIEYLDTERDYVPWAAAIKETAYVTRMLSLTSLNGPFRQFLKDKLSAPFKFFGLNDTGAGHTESNTRSLVARQACKFGVTECLEAASGQFKQWITSRVNRIEPSLKPTVYCYGVKNGGWEEWKFVLDVYQNETDASEHDRLLAAMSCSEEPWILNNFLNLILVENSPIRKQDAQTVISGVAYQTVGAPLAWDFFRANYDLLKDQLGAAFPKGSLVKAVTSGFTSQFDVQQIDDFQTLKSGQLGSGARGFQQAREKTLGNIRWMETNLPVLTEFLTTKGYN